MMFCPHCGNETELVIGAQAAAAEVISDQVEIARINAERDVKVAQIAARQERDWNETRVEVAAIEAEAEVESAASEAEVIGEIIAAAGDDPEPDAEPIVISAGPSEDTEPDDAPPVAEGSPVPDAPSKGKRGLGMW